MVAPSLALLAAAVGVNYSFQPAGDGSNRYDYVVEVEPGLIESLADGNPLPIESHVPDHVSEIRTVRVVLAADHGQSGPSSGPVHRTSYKQWSPSGNSAGTGRTYDNHESAGAASNTPAVQPPRLLGAVQDAGGAMIDATRSGFQDAGQRFQRAGQNLGEAADELSGGTFSRVGDAIRQPFDNSAGAPQGPLQTAGTVAGEFVRDTREQLGAAGQAVRNGTERVLGSGNYRNSTNAPSTLPASIESTRYSNQNDANNPNWNANGNWSDPGGNPFERRGSISAQSGPALTENYRNQTVTSGRQSDWQTEPDNRSLDSQQTVNGQNSHYPDSASESSDLGPVRRRMDDWEVRSREDSYGGNAGGPAGGPATITAGGNNPSAGNPSAGNPWLSSAAQPQTGMASGQTGANPPPQQQQGGFAQNGIQLAGNNYQQQGQNVQLGPDGQPLTPKPWGTLMMVGVALIGSLGANLFLGFSYLDARHKYLSAVRRGTRAFSSVES